MRTSARIFWALAMSFGALASCRGDCGAAGSADAGPPSVTSPRDALRDESRLILERRCGSCHIREYPTALPRALGVFDLREPEWSRRMSDAQLASALARLGQPLPPDGAPNDVSDEERALFKRFVDAEVAARAIVDGAKR